VFYETKNNVGSFKMSNRKVVMAEKNIGILGLITSGIQGGDKLMEYIKENATTEADMAYLREKAGLMASDYYTGLLGHPLTGLTNIDELVTGKRGSYRGQTLDFWGDGNSSTFDIEQAKRYGITPAPDILGVYLGDVTPESQGLKPHDELPSKGYPFKPGPVYNVEDYIFFDGININNSEVSKLLNMKPGDSMKLDQEQVAKYSAIDMGRSNWSVGKNKDGSYYVSVADVWDFKGDDYGTYQQIMEYVGAKPINMYGRFPLNIEGDIQVEQY
tara:strand:- start:6496 stop:7311 length:816 start_codon:yes stop_codon:yes gene_type:complete